jgi:response regulator RpfG family c-di-GMP phosphodiesterase
MKNLLIVDDNAQNLYLLEVLLKTNGYEVEKASNGIEALNLAAKRQPDMIISDILMPGMDGFSLCRAWKADERLRNIPFIFYTATYTDAQNEKFALSLGADRFIAKPTDPGDFLAIMQEVIQNNESKQPVPHADTIEGEEAFNKEYNVALIHKLEDKMLQLEKSNKRLASLYKVSSELHADCPPGDLIDIILQAIVYTAGYPFAAYYRFYEETNRLVSLAATGFPEDIATSFKDKYLFRPGAPGGLVGLAAQNLQTIHIPDTSGEPNWIDLGLPVQSALFAPVHFGKILQGVIGVFSKDKYAFTAEDEHDIEALANNLAISIENKRGQERIQKQLTRISALHNIDQAINASLNLRRTLEVLLEHVLNLLKIDAVDILLPASNHPTGDFIAVRGFKTRKIESSDTRKGPSLDRQVARNRRIIRVTDLSDQEVSPYFVAMWMAEDFKTYIGVPLISKDQVVGVMEAFQRANFDPDMEWMGFLETLAGLAAIAIDNARLFNELQHSNKELRVAYDATIAGWSRAMDLRDKETEGHTLRVTDMSVRLAEMMGISQDQVIHIRRGALLHDIGKLGVPDAVLLKPGRLNEEETIAVRKHPQFAYDMLLPIEYLHPALDIPYCHHEKWDGTGYPRGLKGEQIPLAARLFAVVDVWDALRSDRTYRKAWPEEKVLEYIQEQSGKHFDPVVIEKFFILLASLLPNK